MFTLVVHTLFKLNTANMLFTSVLLTYKVRYYSDDADLLRPPLTRQCASSGTNPHPHRAGLALAAADAIPWINAGALLLFAICARQTDEPSIFRDASQQFVQISSSLSVNACQQYMCVAHVSE